MFHNIAILIDADNASPKLFPEVFAQIEKLGKIGCRKIYGDWAQTNLNSWQENILKYALDAMQQFAYVKGKNATDIALVIDAMDLLYSGQYDCFCLVSSDSDFASLAIRIRKNNIDVYGFGEQKAVSSFRKACTKFVEINPSKIVTTSNTTTPAPKVTATPSPTVQKYTTAQLQKETAFIQILNKILSQQQDEWVNLAIIPNELKQHQVNWKKYGFDKFSDLIKVIQLFDTKMENTTLFCRIKPENQKVKTIAQPITAKPKTNLLDNDLKEHYLQLAMQEDVNAQYELAQCYMNGKGVAQDKQEAVKWYKLSAKQGHIEAQYELALCYEQGNGVIKNLIGAIKWYECSANQGHKQALFRKWYLLATEKHDKDAQYQLALCYENGDGVAQNKEEALKWYRLASQQGHIFAKNKLKNR